MSIRITQDILYKNSLFYLQKSLNLVEKSQIPLLTGKRINNPSDDPFGTVRALKYREELGGLKNYQANLDVIEGQLDSGATTLQSLSSLLTETKAIGIQGADAAMNQADRNSLASQIDQILDEAISLANSHFGGRYLFGGTKTTEPPYSSTGSGTVNYNGDSKVNYVLISSGTKIAGNIPGSEIFHKTDRGETVFEGETGATAGTGADNGKGNTTLSVLHGATSYAGASGVSAGTSSASGDTIIGASGAHTLTLNVGTPPTTGTVSLDDGETVSFDITADPDPADFMLTGASGDKVYLDLTGLSAGYSGIVDITSTGTMSIDGGVTTVDIDFSANQTVYDPSGTVTNVDSTNITRTGDEYLTYTGTFSLFEMLGALRDDLLNTRNLTVDKQVESITSRLKELETSHENVLSGLAEFGGRSLRLEMPRSRPTPVMETAKEEPP